MRKPAWIGIDVGGTKTRLTLFDADLDIVDGSKFRTPKTRKQFAAELTKSTQKLLTKAAGRRLMVSAIGIGAAASINRRKGTIKSAANLPFLAGFSFEKTLGSVCRCEVVLMNDLHAALYGELKVGNAIGYKDVIDAPSPRVHMETQWQKRPPADAEEGARGSEIVSRITITGIPREIVGAPTMYHVLLTIENRYLPSRGTHRDPRDNSPACTYAQVIVKGMALAFGGIAHPVANEPRPF